MAKNDNHPIIIKRGDDEEQGGHHGGAWKIAYGDFMTALMSFFLVMWLLNATTDEQRAGIAAFFNPMAEKGAHLQSTDAMLDVDPSPLTGGTVVRRVIDGKTVEPEQNGDKGGRDTPQTSLPDGSSSDDITRGIKTQLTPSSPAIIPIGGPQSGAAKSVGYVGAENPVAAAYEQARIAQMAAGLQKAVQENPELKASAPNMSVHVERDDIRIELHDASNAPMFDSGSAAPNRLGSQMLAQIGAWLASMPERISIIGYTDAAPYRDGNSKWGMSNWTLSALRADHAREVLVRSGYPDRNILDVSGRADRDLAIPSDPSAAGNRRVVIILHKRYPDPETSITPDTGASPLPASAPAAAPAQTGGKTGAGAPK
ncbi:flagellar motor protein MotB [Komagataeibacter kakiaceti JCM 25156]